MSNQLVMYEEELAQISNICDVLQRDSNAKAVLVIDKNGQAIAQSGEVEQLDVTSLSSLTAGNVAAMGGLAKLIERSSLGLVRLRVRKAAVELTHVLEVLVKKSESGNQPSVFAEITDDDIDNLFND